MNVGDDPSITAAGIIHRSDWACTRIVSNIFLPIGTFDKVVFKIGFSPMFHYFGLFLFTRVEVKCRKTPNDYPEEEVLFI